MGMTRRRFLYAAAALGVGGTALPAVWALLARSPVETGPPAIQYGRDRCDACGMIIGDPHFAAAAREGAAAHRYDDIGCLLTHSGAALASGRAKGFVHDMVSETWIEAAGAMFVRAPEIRSPMGYGLAAYADVDAARAAYPKASTATLEAALALLAKERS
jgi:copper chaperone NosL